MKEEFKVLLLFDGAEKYVNLIQVSNTKFYTLGSMPKPSEIDAIIIFHSKDLNKIDLELFKKLKIIKTITAGTDHIKESYKERYAVIGTHGANAKFIAEHALALALTCSRKLVFHTLTMRKGEFHQIDKHYFSLFNSNVLILGFGPIGRYTAGLFKRTFKANITVYKQRPKISHLYRKTVNTIITEFITLTKVLPKFDVIINTLPLTPQTENLLSKDFFSNLKGDAIIINVSRGKVISEKYLYEFLKKNKDSCAGIDVWYNYPKEAEKFQQNFPFHRLINVVMTPHNAPVVKGYFYNMVKSSMFQIKWDLMKIYNIHVNTL